MATKDNEFRLLTDQEIIDVVKAHLEGKVILCRGKNTVWTEFLDCLDKWDFANFEYRVRPDKYYRKYLTPEEFIEDRKIHGNYIKQGNTCRVLKKYTVMENGEIVYSFSGWSSTSVRTWDEIHDLITWEDGTPFGKLVEV